MKTLVSALILFLFSACAVHQITIDPKVEKTGSADRDHIAYEIASHRNEYLSCYEGEASRDETLRQGKMMINFRVDTSGNVKLAVIQSSTLKNPWVENCILEIVQAIQFPPPSAMTIVTYPFSYSSFSENGKQK